MLLLLVSHALFPLVPLNAHISTVMGLAEKLAGTFAAASIIWFSNWQMPYLAIGLLSLFAAILTPRMLVVTGHTGVGKADSKSTGGDDKKKMTLGQIVRRITRICIPLSGRSRYIWRHSLGYDELPITAL